MKMQFHIRGLNVNAGTRRNLEEALEELQRFIPIAAAAVVLEHQQDNAPAFRAFVLLAVPGPDIQAEASDHTLRATREKVTTDLREQIERRNGRQERQARPSSASAQKRRGEPKAVGHGRS